MSDAVVVALTGLVDKMLKSQNETTQLLRESMLQTNKLTEEILRRSKAEEPASVDQIYARLREAARPETNVVRHNPVEEVFNISDEDRTE